jgi:alpha-beta hydrolase superfamily lysophospholipase
MTHYEAGLDTEDGLNLFVQGWVPEAKSKALIVLVHGLGEHSSRYCHVAEVLNNNGYSVLGFDLRGHGKSGGKRGHSPSFDSFIDDIWLILNEAEGRYPNIPKFLYGHSLGGLLVLNYLHMRRTILAGAVVTGPGLKSSVAEQKVMVVFAKLMGALLPTITIQSGLDPNTLSKDQDVVEAYIEDPLVHDRATLAMAKYSLEAIPLAYEHAGEISTPLLVMHGLEDKLTYPEGSQEYVSLVSGDCTLKLWPGMYHELHNEPEKDDVFSYLIDWLDAHLVGES